MNRREEGFDNNGYVFVSVASRRVDEWLVTAGVGWQVVKLNEELAARYRYSIGQISLGPEIVTIKMYELFSTRIHLCAAKGTKSLPHQALMAMNGGSTFISHSAQRLRHNFFTHF